MSKNENLVLAKGFLHNQKDIEGLANLLDGIGHDERVALTQAMGKKDQKAMWELAKGYRPIALENLVSSSLAPMEQVRHIGKNTLPVFSYFEKRLCRPAQQGKQAQLIGYNWGATRPLVGPGYFVAYLNESSQEVDIDYRLVPTEKPADWPEIKDNESGISKLVFGNMVDSLRRVSEHVIIGSAARNGKPMESWFVLCREA